MVVQPGLCQTRSETDFLGMRLICSATQHMYGSLLQASSNTVETVLEILDNILPTLTETYQTMSPTGSLKRAQAALEELHKQVKNTETTDQLMVGTLQYLTDPDRELLDHVPHW